MPCAKQLALRVGVCAAVPQCPAWHFEEALRVEALYLFTHMPNQCNRKAKGGETGVGTGLRMG